MILFQAIALALASLSLWLAVRQARQVRYHQQCLRGLHEGRGARKWL
jgi:hypothetical protein